MALDIKTIEEQAALMVNSLINSVNTNQSDTTKHVDPTIRNSLIRGLVQSLTAGIDDTNRNIRKVETEIFPGTATEDGLLIDWGVLFGINQNQPAKATGNAIFGGNVGGSIPVSTPVQRANGIQYNTLTAATIAEQILAVDSITRIGTTATVTTSADHNLGSNFVMDNVAGADQTDYNLTDITITVTGSDTFTYEVTGSPTTPATGTITATFTGATTDVEAVEDGDDGNADQGTQLTLVSTITDVDNSLFVSFGDLSGGLDIEDIEDLRVRIQERTSNLVNVFAAKGLEIFIKENVDGVTRVFVLDSFAQNKTVSLTSLISDTDGVAKAVPASAISDFIEGSFITITGANETDLNVVSKAGTQATGGDIIFTLDVASALTGTGTISISYSTVPAGRVVIYFLRDNDTNIIPTGQQVNDVKDAIIDPDNEVKPANTPDEFVIVKAPIAVSVDVTFSSLSPNTTDMQSAISDNLDGFFRNDTELGEDLTLEELNNIIFATTDSNGDTPTFELSAPASDVTIDEGEIATLGTITF